MNNMNITGGSRKFFDSSSSHQLVAVDCITNCLVIQTGACVAVRLVMFFIYSLLADKNN